MRTNKRTFFTILSLIALSIVLLVTLTGCSNKLTEGEVYNKEFKEAHTQLAMIPYISYNGKTTTTIMIPYTYYYPDRYIIYIKKLIDYEWKTAEYYVSKEVYESINIGDEFCYVEGRDLKEEPYTREKEGGTNENTKSDR